MDLVILLELWDFINCWFVFVGIGQKMQHGSKYYVTVTAVNMVDMNENAFSDAVGVDLTPPQTGMVVDLHSVYRIDATSTDNTVAMNAKICLTKDGKTLAHPEQRLNQHLYSTVNCVSIQS